jgi:predicted dehydrogenase
LKRKIPTLVEKPISDSIADAKVMIEAAKKITHF